jgi:4-amino-4-deoxy-L-arabinose transferase-like glycosyltransferase
MSRKCTIFHFTITILLTTAQGEKLGDFQPVRPAIKHSKQPFYRFSPYFSPQTQPMLPALKLRLPLIITLIIFIAFKIPHLSLAYYWDECWPYAVAIKDLYKHGISLMPNAIDAETSRGHPLFFHAIAAIWMHVFGDSHIAMHSFALTISVVFLVIIYETGLRMFNIRVATLALLLVVTQVMFFVQSSMVLFEMLVALLCFLSLACYVREKYVGTAIFLTMLFYTKESGMIMGFVLGIDAIVSFFNKNISQRQRLYRIAALGVPVFLIGCYFLLQKHIQGWYIFPFYAKEVRHTWKDFWYDFRINTIRTTFHDQFRYYLYCTVLLLAIIAAAKQKKLWPLAIFLPATCCWYFVDDMRAGRLLPSVPFFITFLICIVIFLVTYWRSDLLENRQQKRLVTLAFLFTLAFCIFSAMNFFTPRYLLATIVPMLFVAAVFIDRFITITYKWPLYPVAAIIVTTVTLAAIESKTNHGDCDLGSYDGLAVHQDVVDYFEQNVPYDAHISSALFLEEQHLLNPATGFLHSDKGYKNTEWGIDHNTQYVVTDNVEWDNRYEDFKKDTSFYLVKRLERGQRWAEIYKRH